MYIERTSCGRRFVVFHYKDSCTVAWGLASGHGNLKGSCLDVNIITHCYIARASQRQTFAC